MPKESAELTLEESLKGNPRQPGVWCILGEMRLRGHKLPEARAAFENALRMEPSLAQAQFGLAGAWKEQGKPVEAIGCYRRGLASSPENGQALLDLGVLLAEQSQVDEAIACWQRLLVLQPGHATDELKTQIANSSEYARLHADNYSFVESLYQNVLGRFGSADEANYYEQVLAGGASRADVIETFFSNTEHEAYLVDNLYTTFLRRGADTSGQFFFTQAPAAGQSDFDVMAAILSSPEYSLQS